MALQFDLVLLEPADVELLARGAALELPTDVLFVVTNDSVGEASQRGRGSAANCNDGLSRAEVVASTLPQPVERTHLVMMPVVLTPSVRWVTRNLPASLMGW